MIKTYFNLVLHCVCFIFCMAALYFVEILCGIELLIYIQYKVLSLLNTQHQNLRSSWQFHVYNLVKTLYVCIWNYVAAIWSRVCCYTNPNSRQLFHPSWFVKDSLITTMTKFDLLYLKVHINTRKMKQKL